MVEKTVFINSKNLATFVCPECKKSVTKDVSKYKDIDKVVRVNCKCTCGHQYVVLLEKRGFYRKVANLSGVFIFGPEQLSAPMIVKNLSRTGLQFEITDFKEELTLTKGDIIVVEFQLDNPQQTVIHKEVVVRTIVRNSHIGAKFCFVDIDDIRDPITRALNFYLFN